MARKHPKGEPPGPQTDELWMWRDRGTWAGCLGGRWEALLPYDSRKQEREQVWRGRR